MNKIEIIKSICERHPSIGVNKGWSEYVGGMKDTGRWFVEKMIHVPDKELRDFLNKLIEEESKPKVELTEEEKVKSKTFIKLKSGGFQNQLSLEHLEKYVDERERKMFFWT